MAFGGGTWLTQNKVLPGTYMNFASKTKASATISDRGVAALPLPLTWGMEGSVFEVTSEDFRRGSMGIFGYSYGAPAMLALRELFHNANTVFLYRLNSQSTRAKCSVSGAVLATAKYGGSRGNALRLVITMNVDNPGSFDVQTYLDDVLVDEQANVLSVSNLNDNNYVTFDAGTTLVATAGAAFVGGDDGVVNGVAHQKALDALESYTFNTLGCCATDDITKGLYAQYTKRMRDEVGAKFQLVGYRIPDSDYEGVISVENEVGGFSDDIPGMGEQGLVYWTLGAQAGCRVSMSCTNKTYDGELLVNTDYTQKQLGDALKGGKFIFHNASGVPRVLDDRNTLVTLSDTKGAMFQSNQTMRICDQIANDTAVLFTTRYLGTVPNDMAGHMSLWNDVCKLIQEMERIRAVENFDTKTLTIEQGDSKKAVLCKIDGLNVADAMTQLYMAVMIQ